MRGIPRYCVHGSGWTDPCVACGRAIRNGRREALSSSRAQHTRPALPVNISTVGRYWRKRAVPGG